MPANTAEIVASRLAQAADALRRIKVPEIQRRMTAWPDIVENLHTAYPYDKTKVREAPPQSREIDEMDEALSWLRWLDRRQTKIVWARACGWPWWRVCGKFRRSERKMRGEFKAAMERIVRMLDTSERL